MSISLSKTLKQKQGLRLTPSLKKSIDFSSLDIPERQPINSPITTYDANMNSYPDPFSEDEIIFTIDQNNYINYAKDLLTPGQLEMFKTYPETFKMHVYQSRSCLLYTSDAADE